MRTLCSKHAEIPDGLVGRESQCLPMQERCVLICEVDKSSWDGRGCVLAAWQVITIRRARPERRVTPLSLPFPRCQLSTLGLVSGFAGVCEMYEGHIEASSPLRAP